MSKQRAVPLAVCRMALIAALAGAAASALAGPAAWTQGGPPFDVVGIKLGADTLAQARAAMSRFNPPLKPSEQMAVLGKTTYIAALTGKPSPGPASHNVTAVFSIPSEGGRAVYVGRVSGFTPQDAPSVDTVVSALRAKYGEPSYVDRPAGRDATDLYWVWSADGKRLSFSSKNTCASRESFGGSYYFLWSPTIPNNQALTAARNLLAQGCAGGVHALVTARHSVVESLQVYGIDAIGVTRSLEIGAKQLADEEAADAKAAREKAPGQKAPDL